MAKEEQSQEQAQLAQLSFFVKNEAASKAMARRKVIDRNNKEHEAVTMSWSWRDTWQEEHKRAFVIAKMCKADLLTEVHDSLQKALDEGQPFEQWKKEIVPKLEGRWLGKSVGQLWDELSDEEKDKRVRKRLGEAWDDLTEDEKREKRASYLSEEQRKKVIAPKRLELIFRTNMAVANAAGHYSQLMKTKDIYPYWRYVTRDDARVRTSHRALHNRVYKWDDPFWATFFPPNGFRCRCHVSPLTKRQVERDPKLHVEQSNIAEDADGRKVLDVGGSYYKNNPGWDYNPGDSISHLVSLAKSNEKGRPAQVQADLEADLAKKEAEEAAAAKAKAEAERQTKEAATKAEAERLEAEKKAKEEERRKAEETEKAEKTRQEAEHKAQEARRAEAERQAKEAAAKAEAERLEAEKKAKKEERREAEEAEKSEKARQEEERKAQEIEQHLQEAQAKAEQRKAEHEAKKAAAKAKTERKTQENTAKAEAEHQVKEQRMADSIPTRDNEQKITPIVSSAGNVQYEVVKDGFILSTKPLNWPDPTKVTVHNAVPKTEKQIKDIVSVNCSRGQHSITDVIEEHDKRSENYTIPIACRGENWTEADVIKAIANRKTEYGFLFDENGTVLAGGKGTANSVKITDVLRTYICSDIQLCTKYYEAGGENMSTNDFVFFCRKHLPTGLRFIHNHPNDSIYSANDVFQLLCYNLDMLKIIQPRNQDILILRLPESLRLQESNFEKHKAFMKHAVDIRSVAQHFSAENNLFSKLLPTKIEELLNSQHFSKEKSLYGSWFTMEALDGE